MNEIHFKADKEKQMLYGPFLIPNMLIYRSDDTNGEYYVRFSAEEIEKIATKFNSDLNSKNINLQHTDKKVEAFVAQNWMIEGEQDKSKNLGFDLPEGTWFGGVKIIDKEFWDEKVKTNEVKGFSVEILADLELQLKNKEQKMKKQIKLGSAMLGDGSTPVYFDGESIGVGTAIFTDEAMTMPASDDRWVLEDGRIIVVMGGVVESVEEAQEVEENMASANLKDGVTVYWDGEFGMGVTIYVDEAMTQLAPNADHVLEDGTVVTTVDGVVTNIEVSAIEEDLAEAPVAQALTAEEVSSMIDSRFSELMDEVTKLKELVGQKDDDMKNYKKEVEEKFSMTAATKSITKAEPKMDDKFSKVEARIREFAKNK